jgi:hypothetical protein
MLSVDHREELSKLVDVWEAANATIFSVTSVTLPVCRQQRLLLRSTAPWKTLLRCEDRPAIRRRSQQRDIALASSATVLGRLNGSYSIAAWRRLRRLGHGLFL